MATLGKRQSKKPVLPPLLLVLNLLGSVGHICMALWRVENLVLIAL
jgi:hypothetical protein